MKLGMIRPLMIAALVLSVCQGTAQTPLDRFEKNKQNLKEVLEKGLTARLSGGEQQALANYWFAYSQDIRMPQYVPSAPIRPDPALEQDYAQVEAVQKKLADLDKSQAAASAQEDEQFFAANIPGVCKLFPKTAAFQKRLKEEDEYVKMATLLQAGETDKACEIRSNLSTRAEEVRVEIIGCYNATEPLSAQSAKMRNLSQGVLYQSSNMQRLIQNLAQVGKQYGCE